MNNEDLSEEEKWLLQEEINEEWENFDDIVEEWEEVDEAWNEYDEQQEEENYYEDEDDEVEDALDEEDVYDDDKSTYESIKIHFIAMMLFFRDDENILYIGILLVFLSIIIYLVNITTS